MWFAYHEPINIIRWRGRFRSMSMRPLRVMANTCTWLPYMNILFRTTGSAVVMLLDLDLCLRWTEIALKQARYLRRCSTTLRNMWGNTKYRLPSSKSGYFVAELWPVLSIGVQLYCWTPWIVLPFSTRIFDVKLGRHLFCISRCIDMWVNYPAAFSELELIHAPSVDCQHQLGQ